LVWTIDYTDTARRALRKMDRHSARQIVEYLTDRIGAADDPHDFGKSLKGPLGDYWRYRVGDYRIICEIHENAVRVLVVDIGHRREVYKR
jgi:mRNA interferase RelE/StbE